MADISHESLLESLGDAAAGFTKKVANEAANFSCSLYRQYPWALTLGDWGGYSKGFWDQLCAQRPGGLPSAPKPGFSGGQCDSDRYYISFTGTRVYANGSEFNENVVFAVYGPIRSIRYGLVDGLRPDPYSGTGVEVDCKGIFWRGGNDYYSPQPQGHYGKFLGQDTPASFRHTDFVISRWDGGTDTCGDPPSEHPHVPIPEVAKSTTVSVSLSDNSSINIPITFQPITNNYELNLKAGDISLNFDLAGVHINRNSPDFNTLNKQISNITNNVSNLAQNFATYYNNSTAYSSSFNLFPFTTKSDSGSSKPPDEKASDNLAYVTVNLTRYPSNARTQEGELAQDVMYAGWFQFASEGFYYPREPIHFIKSIFKAPPGSTSFAYTLYHGFEANVVEHRA